jgi:hypothetical protein
MFWSRSFVGSYWLERDDIGLIRFRDFRRGLNCDSSSLLGMEARLVGCIPIRWICASGLLFLF